MPAYSSGWELRPRQSGKSAMPAPFFAIRREPTLERRTGKRSPWRLTEQFFDFAESLMETRVEQGRKP